MTPSTGDVGGDGKLESWPKSCAVAVAQEREAYEGREVGQRVVDLFVGSVATAQACMLLHDYY